MNAPMPYETLAALKILTSANRIMAEGYAALMMERRPLNWKDINGLIAASVGWDKLSEIKRDAQRLILVRNQGISDEVERMRVYSRQVVSIKCAGADCTALIRPGDWAFWPGGADKHSGFICETCAVSRAIGA